MGHSLGWECPKCGRVYAPVVHECALCNSVVRHNKGCMICGSYHGNRPCPVTFSVDPIRPPHG